MREEAESAAPILRGIQRLAQHEGDTFTEKAADGKTTRRSGFQQFERRFEIPMGLSEQGTFAAVKEALADLSEGFTRDAEGSLLKAFEAACDAAGQKVDAGGKPPSPELLLAALEGVEIEFDFHGVAKLPEFVVHPEIAEAMANAWVGLTSGGVYREALEKLIVKKRRDWVVRQSNRKLVG